MRGRRSASRRLIVPFGARRHQRGRSATALLRAAGGSGIRRAARRRRAPPGGSGRCATAGSGCRSVPRSAQFDAGQGGAHGLSSGRRGLRHAVWNAEDDLAVSLALRLCDAVPGILNLPQDGQGVRVESPAGRRQFDPAWQAVKERLAEFVFELCELLAERGLRDMDRGGGLGEAACSAMARK